MPSSSEPGAGRFRRVCVFCGSSPGARPEYREAAAELGRLLAREGIGLVYGGGSVGLMGAVADGALLAGGEVIGVIPQALQRREIVHHGATEMRVVGSMHERKALMNGLADAFIVLPGGYGTLDELFEVTTWGQLGIHQKPIGLLNVAGYFDALLAFVRHTVAEGLVRAAHGRLLLVETDSRRLLDALAGHRPPSVPKWIGPGET